MRTDAAVAVTVQSGRIAACPAVSLTGDEIDERCFLGLLHGLPLSATARDTELGQDVPGARAAQNGGVFGSIRAQTPLAKREIGSGPDRIAVRPDPAA
jgi:hypothetical protein